MIDLRLERLKELLSYNPEDGSFRWLVARGRMRAGQSAGRISASGYFQIQIDRVLYLSHRLAWMYVHGYWPSMHLDHIDGNRINNSIVNLRECRPFENHQNRVAKPDSGSRYLGVSWDKNREKWTASITLRGQKKFLGRFSSEIDAAAAYRNAKRELHLFNPEIIR